MFGLASLDRSMQRENDTGSHTCTTHICSEYIVFNAYVCCTNIFMFPLKQEKLHIVQYEILLQSLLETKHNHFNEHLQSNIGVHYFSNYSVVICSFDSQCWGIVGKRFSVVSFFHVATAEMCCPFVCLILNSIDIVIKIHPFYFLFSHWRGQKIKEEHEREGNYMC